MALSDYSRNTAPAERRRYKCKFVRLIGRLRCRSRPNFGLSALSSRQRRWSALWFTAGFRSVSGARKWEAKNPPPFGEAQIYRR